MKGISRSINLALATLLALFATAASAELPSLTYDHGLAQTSLATAHFDPDPEHNNHQHLASLELHNPDNWFTGIAWLKNSFNQPTWYFYGGRQFPLWQPSEEILVRAKLTAGLLHGYDGDRKDKIPLNHFGTAPAILPTLGVRLGPIETDIMIFGAAGAMATAGVRF